jgi:radical SAM superfamily enzyme YgiQ (UPF0313 family)
MKILLCVLNNDNYIHYFPLGIAYLASVLRNQGHKVTIYNQDVHHYSDEHITRFLDMHSFDIVATGAISGYYTYKRLLAFSKVVNASKSRPYFRYIIGGHMPSSDPEYFLEKTNADNVIKGEGELAFKDLTWYTPKIIEGKLVDDLDNLPFPAYNMFPMEYYRLQRFPNIENNEFSMSVLTGRGCSFNCTFCYRLTQGIRLRSVKNIVDEIRFLKAKYNISYIDFSDDLTFASKDRTVELAEALMPLNIKWRCEGRLNYTDSEILKLVKRAGCVFINYGIEALDDKVLAGMKKALTVSQIINGIEATIKEGISPGLNIMWGNIGDTKETLRKAVDFLTKYDDGSQMRTISPVQPYPGSELFETAKQKGLVKDTADFYENKLKNSDLLSINFTELSDDEFYKALYSANFALLYNYYKNRIESVEKKLKQLYIEKDANFRGWRHN